MNGFYTVIRMVAESGNFDRVPVAIAFYDPLKHKTYVRKIVPSCMHFDLENLLAKLGYLSSIEGFVRARLERPTSYELNIIQNCKILSYPKRTLDAIEKKEFGKVVNR